MRKTTLTPFGEIDALDRLIQTISAHGDAMAVGFAAELADGTLTQLGQAFYDTADAVRAILDQVEAQRLGQASHPRSGVSEDRVLTLRGALSRRWTARRSQRHRCHIACRAMPADRAGRACTDSQESPS